MALLVVLGAMSDGRKQVLAVRPGHRESTESWLSVLRDLRDRGLRAPVLMMADGALPIWSAVDQVWPETSQQRCWNHKIINVLDNLPKRGQGKARVLLTQIPTATTRAQAEARRRHLCRSLPGPISQGGCHPRTRLGAHGHFLRLPPAALAAPAHDKSGGKSLCVGTPADQRWQTAQASTG